MTSDDQHMDVGAYVLGALEDAEATRFEEHLAGCERCGEELEALMGVESLLAEFAADTPAGRREDDLLPEPAPEMLDRLVGEVHAARRTARRKRWYLAAAAAVLIIASPVATVLVVERNGSPPSSVSVSATNRATDVEAAIVMTDRTWGTDIALTLSGVKGPLECELVAVSTGGTQQTVATWSVPGWGYGVPGHPKPLSVHGGTGIPRRNIDHFVIRTLQGSPLVTVRA